jgi:hypothetical protein
MVMRREIYSRLGQLRAPSPEPLVPPDTRQPLEPVGATPDLSSPETSLVYVVMSILR